MNVLALSSSRVGNGGYLSAAKTLLADFLGGEKRRVAFVPFAAVDGLYADYISKVEKGLEGLSLSFTLVEPAGGQSIIENADVIMIGGGNTFKLLHDIYQHDLYSLIKKKVETGTPYIGWSAGANLTGATIGTTNDMPIIEPRSFKAFRFLPFQLNPHYHNAILEDFHGETRDQRLTEYCLLNERVPIVGLPEGTALCLQNNTLTYKGHLPAVLFQSPSQGSFPTKKDLLPGADLSFLLNTSPQM